MSGQEIGGIEGGETLSLQPQQETVGAGAIEGNQAADQIGFFINRYYLHDLSVENPVGRVANEDAALLHYSLDGKVEARSLEAPNTSLVEINMQLTAKLREQIVFLVDTTFRVEVELRGIPEPVVPFTLSVNVPEAFFPILQEILQRNADYAGYPEMQIGMPDFRALYVANHGM